jgi:uncharacterized protein YecT (DUF1311 family)
VKTWSAKRYEDEIMKTLLPMLLIGYTCVVTAFAGDNNMSQLEEDYALADKRLNNVYQAALQKIKESTLPTEAIAKHVAQQRNAQRAWIKFRDEEAKLSEYRVWRAAGGRSEHLDSVLWKTRLTIDRTKQL